jgi:hypothetical protein
VTDIGLDQSGGPDFLRGWKEIADYLHSSVRTVQRWEHALGLPVIRNQGVGTAAILARRKELSAWAASITGQKALAAARREGEATGEASSPASDTSDPGPMAQEQAEDAPLPAPPRTRRLIPALVVAAVMVGAIALAWSRGWLFAPSDAVSASPGPSVSPTSLGSPTASTSSPAPQAGVVPGSTPDESAMLMVRFSLSSGTSNVVGVQIGRTATLTMRNKTTYVLTADVAAAGTRVHVSGFERVPESKDAVRLTEFGTVTLRQGVRVAVEGVPGVLAMEWLAPDALKTLWPK